MYPWATDAVAAGKTSQNVIYRANQRRQRQLGAADRTAGIPRRGGGRRGQAKQHHLVTPSAGHNHRSRSCYIYIRMYHDIILSPTYLRPLAAATQVLDVEDV